MLSPVVLLLLLAVDASIPGLTQEELDIIGNTDAVKIADGVKLNKCHRDDTDNRGISLENKRKIWQPIYDCCLRT
jgi:hypothetical protein